jgi:outer membrane cobalamin receptor
MKKTCLLLLLITFINLTFAQPPEGNGIIKGVLKDKELDKPIEYANAVLYKKSDSTLVNGAISDEKGAFIIKNIDTGNYYLQLNFVGYKREIIKDVVIDQNTKMLDIGEVALNPAIKQLDEIAITEERDVVSIGIDKKVVNADKSIIAAGGTAAEVLETVPSVSVDVNGSLTLRGSSFFTVFVDGKPTIMQGMNALRQIPAGSIKQIEIITSPSAKYDPDGDAGIINVILKRNEGEGISGMLNASIANRSKYAADGLFNYNKNKISLFGGFNFNYQNILLIKDDQTTTNFENGFKKVNAETDGSYQRKNADVRAGFDYFINKNNTLSFSTNFGYQGLSRGFDQTINATSDIEDVPFYALNRNDAARDANFVNAIGTYTTEFNKKGHKLDMMATYSSQNTEDFDQFNEYLSNAQYQISSNDLNQYRTDENWDSYSYRLQTDYTLPVKSGKLEAGFQYRNEQDDRSFNFNDNGDAEWTDKFLTDNTSDFSRIIVAGYVNYANKINKLSYEAGMRNEYTDRSLKTGNLEQPFVFNQLNWFPSASLSRPIGENSNLRLAYNKRINRSPDFYLDPFITISNRYSFWQGNPELVPEFSDKVELSYQTKLGKTSLTFDLYHNLVKNNFARVQDFYDIEDNITFFRFANTVKRENTALDINFSSGVGKWLRVMGNFETGYSLLDGNFSSDNSLNQGELNRTFSSQRSYFYTEGKINSILLLPKGWKGQVLVVYIGGQDFIQGFMPTILFASAAVKKSFLNNRLSATVSLNDIFGSFIHILERESTYQDYPQFQSRYLRQREPQVVKLALSFNFNKFKKSSRRAAEDRLAPTLEEDF